MYWSLASLFMNSHKDCCRRIAEQVGKPAQITHLFGTPHSNAAMLNTRLNRLVAVKKITESSSTAVAYTITRVPTGMWSDSSIQLPCLSPQLPSQLKEVVGVRAATLRSWFMRLVRAYSETDGAGHCLGLPCRLLVVDCPRAATFELAVVGSTILSKSASPVPLYP